MENKTTVSLLRFLTLLLKNEEEIVEAHKLGLIDKDDTKHPDEAVVRKKAAKIFHMYLLNVMHVKDEDDISPASIMKDLYDCRVCVNHIAQVYLKGIMKAHEYPGGLILFEPDVEISEAEGMDALENLN